MLNGSWEKMKEEQIESFSFEPVYEKDTDKMNILDVKCMLIDFGIWLDKNDRHLENGNITENVDDFLNYNKKHK
jgi:hypothetical protein